MRSSLLLFQLSNDQSLEAAVFQKKSRMKRWKVHNFKKMMLLEKERNNFEWLVEELA
jgi:hypothetical protein